MEEKPIRLGGMALQNGVLVHGMTSWACAVRDAGGELHVASGRKPHLAPAACARFPIMRGPIALAEAFALLPMVRRALPQARFPFERPAVLASIAAMTVTARALRRSRLRSGAREAVVAGVAFVPALLALRGPDLAAYHGAEHISIGTYENGGTPAPKEHPRCGSQLIAPMVASTLAVNVVASKAPPGTRSIARLAGTLAAVAGSVELFSWVARNPDKRAAQLLAQPGFELQRRLSTAEPSDAQLAVANVARDTCLALERPPA